MMDWFLAIRANYNHLVRKRKLNYLVKLAK